MTSQEINPSFEAIPNNLTLIEKMKDVGSSAKLDLWNTNLYGKATLVALGAMTFYEWGPGNEAATPIIAGQAL